MDKSLSVPKGAKPSKVASKNQTRPVLTRGEIVERDGAFFLQTTDSYKLAEIPLTVEPGQGNAPVAGPVPAEALKAIDRAGTFTANGDVTVTNKDGSATSFSRQGFACEGTYPDTEKLFPAPEKVTRFGVNAKYLYELAQALGSELVELEFDAAQWERAKDSDGNELPDANNPVYMKPAVVRPLGMGRSNNTSSPTGGRGVIMPIRLS